MKTSLVSMAVLALVVAGCSPKLEEGEVLEKQGDTFTIRLSQTINEPIDEVWAAFQHPENLEKYSEQYQQSKLVKEEGNTKVLDMRVQALGQINAFTMQMEMKPDAKQVSLKTIESSLVEITGDYELKPTADGKGTVVTYRATQKDKVNIPAPVSVQKSAIKESFDNLIAAVKKQLGSAGAS